MNKNSKNILIGAGALAGIVGTILLIKRRYSAKKRSLSELEDMCLVNTNLKKIAEGAHKKDIIGFNVEDSILYYQTQDNNIIAFHLLEDREEICRVYIPSENKYSTFSELFENVDVSYLLEVNDFDYEREYAFEVGVYSNKTGKFLDALVYDVDANVFIHE